MIETLKKFISRFNLTGNKGFCKCEFRLINNHLHVNKDISHMLLLRILVL